MSVWFDDDVDHYDHDDHLDIDYRFDEFVDFDVDCFGAEAVGAGVVSAFVVAAREACSSASVAR